MGPCLPLLKKIYRCCVCKIYEPFSALPRVLALTVASHELCLLVALVPPDNKLTLAHSALLSWAESRASLRTQAKVGPAPASGGLGARDFWFAGSRFRAFPHHKFEANFPTL